MEAIKKHVQELINEYQVHAASPKTLARQLSGGHLQRLVLARESSRELNLIIAVNPTAGLDVGATEYVRAQLLNQRRLGRAILLISADLEELLSISDRIAVLFSGRIVGSLDSSNSNPEEIGLMMGGTLQPDGKKAYAE
jgi:simple sugar transport system ATP-binding protein